MAEASRPTTTLFLNLSVDGRTTSHDSDDFDPNKDWKKDPKILARMHPFFEFAKGPIHTLTYGRLLVKTGINTRTSQPKKLKDVHLIVIDDLADLTSRGLNFLAHNFATVYLVGLPQHPIHQLSPKPKNLIPISPTTSGQKPQIDLTQLMNILFTRYHIKAVSLQPYTPLNARWLSLGLIDHLSVIISPLLIGTYGTPALIDQELARIKPLVLDDVQPFGLSFVNIRYNVLND